MRKSRILIVDDETGFTRMVKLVLRRYDICEENDPRHAVETALSFQPDVVLMDVVMPGIDGGNLAAKFKADALLRRIPIIFLTAVVSPSEAGQAPRHIGGYPFLAKPVCPDALERCIEEQLTTF
jgi:two-component system OmpR family response regulator